MQQCWAGGWAGTSYWVNWRDWQMKSEKRPHDWPVPTQKESQGT